MKNIVCLAVILFTALSLFSQDKIYKNRGNLVHGKVIEIGTDEIKYTLKDKPDGPVYVVEKSMINRIEYEDGHVEKFTLSFKDTANYSGQLGKAIKVNFLSPLLGYTYIAFEKSLTPLKGYELGLAIIGAGKNEQIGNYYIGNDVRYYKRSAFGFMVDAGYKYKKLPNFFNKGSRMTHIMQGTYFLPKAFIGYYTDHGLNFKNNEPVLEKRNHLVGALTINLGKQWVFGDRFLLDFYYGLGYAFDNRNSNEDYFDYYDNHFVIQKAGNGTNLCFTGGIRVGLLIK